MAIQTKKRKNKSLPLIILVGVLVVMIIAYSALSTANDKKEAEEAAKIAAENADIMIASYDASTVTKLSYQAAGSDKLTFLCSGGVWSYADDAKFPLNQTTVSSMASAISSIAAECEVNEGTAADYGLDAPAYTISVTYSDGTSHTYKIGDYNSFNSSYYFSADGDMYMITSGLTPYFSYELDDLLVLDTLPTSDWSDMNYVNEITVKTADGENTITDEEGKTALLDKISSISLTNCADYYAESAEKTAFGLDESSVITVKYKKAVTTTDDSGNESTSYLETSYVMNIGAAVGHNEGYYFCPANSNIVYVVDEETVLEILAYVDYVPAETEETEAETEAAAE